MIAVAAIDLLDGQAVQLVKGDPEAARIRRPDPVEVATGWVEQGFERLHVIDLDAALGRGGNRAAIEALIDRVGVPVQVGGGVRDRATAHRWVEAGADRVIVGTRAIEDPRWGASLAADIPGRVVVAADVKAGEVTTHGWTAGSGRTLAQLLAAYEGAPLAGVLVTDVDREGQERGCDLELFADAVAAGSHPLLAAGSVSSAVDLAGLAEIGVAEAVLGMALYTGRIAPAAIRPWLSKTEGERS